MNHRLGLGKNIIKCGLIITAKMVNGLFLQHTGAYVLITFVVFKL